MDRLNLDALRSLSLTSRSGGSSRGDSRRRTPSDASSDATIIDDGPPALERLQRANLEKYGAETMGHIRLAELQMEHQLSLGQDAFGGSQWSGGPGSVSGSTASWVAGMPASYIDPRSGSCSVAGSQAHSNDGNNMASSAAGSVAGSSSSRKHTSAGYRGLPVSGGRSHRTQGSFAFAMPTSEGKQIEAYWPNIKPMLTSDAVLEDYTLPCPQCAISMSAAEAGNQHRGMILCCGHMMCEGCITRITANEKQCPYCAVPVGKYSDCAESCKNPGMIGLGLPGNMAELKRFPRTTSEGGSLPGCCSKCRILRVERDTKKMVRHILNDARARSVWNPSSDHKPDTRDYSDYVRVPELDHFLAVLRDTVHSAEIHRQYTWLPPDHRSNYAQVWAEKRDYTRPRPGDG
ncbi:hypothetical protein CI238_09211 [Colletotrichum incanum]|uniref:Uncharacterized protein n=1 Tax=Colletotrichum incanum TaxID=1573173 RepID=A0A162PAG2_COLIC|nr:hypothetical protein CI238_09211 [Colletotrichum incanum]OHW95140.1 hypothetical protein CSPAE12_06235 [Colletotrichum incanum]